MSSGPQSGALSTLVHSTHSVHTSSHSAPPTQTPKPVATTTTLFSDPFADGVSAYITPCPDRPGTPTVVHVVIHTTVTITDFARYYKTPISSFQPSYIALQDGSLISSVYQDNLHVSEGWLVMGGALSVFFLRNTYRALQYTRTVNVKNKSLFYMLVVSQAIGLIVSVIFVAADFTRTFDCTA